MQDKKEKKKGTVAVGGVSFLRRGKKVRYACSPFATSFLYTGKESSLQKLGEAKVSKNPNHRGMEIKTIKMLIYNIIFMAPLKIEFWEDQ